MIPTHPATIDINNGFLFFWNDVPSVTSTQKDSYLSQWYPATFSESHITYNSAEHYMMAQKALLFNDEQMFCSIIQSDHPGQAASLGRRVKNFDEQTWINERFRIVTQASILKFGQNSELNAYLQQTSPKTIVLANPWDRIWGIGLDEYAPQAKNPANWKGLNLLGYALMKAREVLGKK